MYSNEVSAKHNLPFLYTWKLERLFSFTSSSGKLWEYSSVFPAGGYRWKLALNLGKVEVDDGKSYLSLFLALLDTSSLPLHIEVVLKSCILNENYSQCSKTKVKYKFRQSKSEGCHPYLVSLETLKCPSAGFLVAEIIDVIIHSEENVFLSPKPESNCSLAYTWKIDGFSKLAKQSYTSGPFLFNDHIWYMNLYPKGNSKDGKSISLYLNLDDASTLAPSVKVRAEYYIDWVDQIKGKNHRRQGLSVFDWKSQSCGWRNFLSLDALHDPSDGLLVNDTCIIKLEFLKCDVSK